MKYIFANRNQIDDRDTGHDWIRRDEEIKENKHKIIFEQTITSTIKANTRNKLVFQRHKSWNIKHNGRKSMSCDVYIYSNEQYMFCAIRQHNKNKQNKLNSLLCYLQNISSRDVKYIKSTLDIKRRRIFLPKNENQANSMLNVLSKAFILNSGVYRYIYKVLFYDIIQQDLKIFSSMSEYAEYSK